MDTLSFVRSKIKATSACSLLLLAVACAGPAASAAGGPALSDPAAHLAPGQAVATFAGGCFWCMQHPFDLIPGVVKTVVGYTGGHTADPTYEEVSAGGTGHAESVDVIYDPKKVSYEKLLDTFWHNVDPVAVGHQFCDWGDQYRSEIFYHSEEQKRLAETSKEKLAASGILHGPITTKIVPAGPFYRAEEYHQDYYKKNPIRYHFYRTGCGRDARLRQLWGDQAGKP